MEMRSSINMEVQQEMFPLHGVLTLLAIIFLIGLATNIPLLIVYLKSKQVRSGTEKFLVNLWITDLFSVSLLVPIIFIDWIQYDHYSTSFNQDSATPNAFKQFNGIQNNDTSYSLPNQLLMEYDYWNGSCSFKNGLLSTIITASVLAVLGIAAERFLAIVLPLSYYNYLTKKSVFISSIIATFIAIGCGIVSSFDPSPSIFPSCYAEQVKLQDFVTRSQQNGIKSQDYEVTTEELWWSIYNLAHVLMFFILPIILMTIIYTSIWLEARKQRLKMNKRYRPFYLNVPDKLDNDLKDTSMSHPRVVKSKLLNFLKKKRMERATCAAVFSLAVTALCWSPCCFVKVSHAIRSIFVVYTRSSEMNAINATVNSDIWSISLKTVIPLLLAILHPILAPVFYSYRYNFVRQRMARLGLIPFECCTFDGLKDCYKPNILDKKINGPPKSVNGSQNYPSQIKQNIDTSIESVKPCEELQQENFSTSSTKKDEMANIKSEETNFVPNTKPCITNGHFGIEIHVLSEDGLDIPDENDSEVSSKGGDLVKEDNHLNSSYNLEANTAEGNNGLTSAGTCNNVIVSPSGFANCLTFCMGFYTKRWNLHRSSVTSTASFITLLSTRNKVHPVTDV